MMAASCNENEIKSTSSVVYVFFLLRNIAKWTDRRHN